MKKRRFSFLLSLGITLIAISLIFVVAFQVRLHIGSSKGEEIAVSMKEILDERSKEVTGDVSDKLMPILEIEGTDYVAMLEIPSQDVTLPVASGWDKNKLHVSPARFYGSCYDKTLVIGGGDYSHQFSFCDKLDVGEVIILTDMTGRQFGYTVSRVDRSRNATREWLTENDCDLTLFCQDLESMKYLAVRCEAIYG